MRTAFVVSALAFVVPALCVPTRVPIVKRDGPVKPNSYIVSFKDEASKESALSKLAEKLKGNLSSGSSMTYDYGSLFPGIAVVLDPSTLDFVRGMSGVESIEPDSIVSVVDSPPNSEIDVTSPVASGALVRRGNDAYNGQGVTVYGIDTGIYTEHSCFGGRATWGATFGGYDNKDGNGHGTHTAATAVCKTYGVATGAEVVAVKVLSDEGSGAVSNVVAGVQYALQQHKARGGPSVVTMSLGGPETDSALRKAVQAAIEAGVHFTIAAGNSNVPADKTSPANVEEANTIGAVDSNKNNQKASFSNYGRLIDVWAPGVNIKSAWIGNSTAENTISGTSMATPYVAGILATVLSKCRDTTPADLSQQLKDHAAKSVTFAPTDALAAELTPNKLFAQLWDCKA